MLGSWESMAKPGRPGVDNEEKQQTGGGVGD